MHPPGATVRSLGRNKQPTSGSRDHLWSTLGIITLLGVWALAARDRSELLLPSPAETWRAAGRLIDNGVYFSSLATTLTRAIAGVAVAFVIGAIWGVLAGRIDAVSAFGRPLIAALMAVPPVVVVVVGLLWFGPTGGVARFVVILVALPMIILAVEAAVRALDPDLAEMARSFGLSRRRTLAHLVIPGISSPVLAAMSVVLGHSLRVAVMAELLSSSDGVGFELARSRTNLDSSALFAWAALLVATVLAIEQLILRPVERRTRRWRLPPAQAERGADQEPDREAGGSSRSIGAVPGSG